MTRAAFDTSRYPLVIATFPSDATPEDCRQYSYDIAEICRKYSNILYLIDARNVDERSIKQELRTAMAGSFNEISDTFDKSIIARAHLVSNQVMIGMFAAFHWLLPKSLTSPRKIFTDYDEAVNWLMQYKK